MSQSLGEVTFMASDTLDSRVSKLFERGVTRRQARVCYRAPNRLCARRSDRSPHEASSQTGLVIATSKRRLQLLTSCEFFQRPEAQTPEARTPTVQGCSRSPPRIGSLYELPRSTLRIVGPYERWAWDSIWGWHYLARLQSLHRIHLSPEPWTVAPADDDRHPAGLYMPKLQRKRINKYMYVRYTHIYTYIIYNKMYYTKFRSCRVSIINSIHLTATGRTPEGRSSDAGL